MGREQNSFEYAALIPVYAKDEPKWLDAALRSLLTQTIPPSQIVVVTDGPITPDLDALLRSYSARPEFRICEIPSNVGLGRALEVGVNSCDYELIARLDADDYAVPIRCETQLKFLEAHPEVGAVGTNVLEFTDAYDHIVSKVRLPASHNEILTYAKRRNPIRHPALMYRKSAVIAAGNYRDFRYAQDYDLVVRMLVSGAQFANIQEDLTFMRVGADFYRRRGGWRYLKVILRLKREFVRYGFYSWLDFLIAAVGHAIVILFPTRARQRIYRTFLRRPSTPDA